MVAPLASNWIGYPHLSNLAPQVYFQRVSLNKVFVVIVLRLQNYFFNLLDCALDRDYRLQIIYIRDHLLCFEILDKVDSANKVVVILPVPQHLLNMSHFYFVGAFVQQFQDVVNSVMPLFVVRRGLDFVVLVVLSVHEQVPESWEIHYEVLFVVQKNTSHLHR